MNKKEQLKEVFTKEVREFMDDREIALIDNLIVPMQSIINNKVNVLLKRVTTRKRKIKGELKKC